MADNTSPLFAITPKLGKCNVSAANTNRDGSGTIVTLFTAAQKTKITKIWYVAEVTTTAGMIRLYISDSAGNNPDLFEELPITAITVGANTKAATGYVEYTDFTIPAGHVISASTHNAESSNVFILIGELDS